MLTLWEMEKADLFAWLQSVGDAITPSQQQHLLQALEKLSVSPASDNPKQMILTDPFHIWHLWKETEGTTMIFPKDADPGMYVECSNHSVIIIIIIIIIMMMMTEWLVGQVYERLFFSPKT
jgi:hypothetical protein